MFKCVHCSVSDYHYHDACSSPLMQRRREMHASSPEQINTKRCSTCSRKQHPHHRHSIQTPAGPKGSPASPHPPYSSHLLPTSKYKLVLNCPPQAAIVPEGIASSPGQQTQWDSDSPLGQLEFWLRVHATVSDSLGQLMSDGLKLSYDLIASEWVTFPSS